MKRQAAAFKVGLFTLTSVALLVLGLAVVAEGRLFQKVLLCETYILESVNGLAVGSPTKYRGVLIGEVKGIGFPSQDYKDPSLFLTKPYSEYVMVTMSINVADTEGMNLDELESLLKSGIGGGLRCRLTLAGITGGSYVELEMMDPARYPPPQIDWVPHTLYIPSAPSKFDEILGALQTISQGLAQVDFAGLSSSAHKLMGDLDAVVTVEARSTLDRVGLAAQELRNTLADPAIAATLKNLESSTADLSDVLGSSKMDLKKLIADLPVAVESLRTLAVNLNKTVLQDSPELHRLLLQLNRIADDLSHVSERLRLNPAGVLLGEPPPRLPVNQP
ncbi:MAG: MCE family protein [Phycisphaerales bacterium]|nr:MCE family protein [Phycisphaerales bacterium]